MDENSDFEKAFREKESFLFLVPAGEFREEDFELIDLSRFQRPQFELMPFMPLESGEEDVEIGREEYLYRLSLIIGEMQKGEYSKVVYSRIKKTKGSFDTQLLEHVFRKLVIAYPTAHVFLFRTSDGQLWMGASPELLFRRRGQKIETMALAGTQRRLDSKEMTDYSWGRKELDEHQVVIDFIVDRIKETGAPTCIVGETKTVAAGNLVHLKTNIEFESSLEDSALAEILHPTPAVCGFPRGKAKEVIQKYETHKRDYYAGYIGLKYPNGDVDYIVNLRSMRIYPDHFSLFVGGGINAQSDPESEWQETELKSQTLLNVIQSVGK